MLAIISARSAAAGAGAFEALFRPEQVVFDIVYTPLDTKLLREAKAKGLQCISGVEMFVNQAVLQFERFTGAQAPVEVMRQVVMEHLTL